jgi:hypothetical protein
MHTPQRVQSKSSMACLAFFPPWMAFAPHWALQAMQPSHFSSMT